MALVRAGGVREVARVALLGGYGHDLTAEAEHRARARGRDVGAPHVVRAVLDVGDEARARLDEVGGDTQRELRALLRCRVVEVQPARLLVDDLAPAGDRAD